jgi:uncharacterized protein
MNPKLLLVPLVAGLGLLAVACSGGDTYVTSDNSGQTGINATGTGIAYGEPDIMLLTVGVSAQRDTIEAAREAAATAQNGVIQALKDNGVDEKDIQTVQFNVSPQYDYSTKPNGQGEIIGYIVSNVVNAKVRDLDKAGDAIDAATMAGGNDAVVQGVSFDIDDPTDLQKQAREEAVKKAKDQAQQLATNAGAKLGKLISISESSYFPTYDRGIPAAAGGVGLDSSTTPIQTGQLEVSVTVNLLYAIE